MGKTATSTGRPIAPVMSLSQLRHDIRNHLNAIKLSCALLHRRPDEQPSREFLQEIERSADGINELVTRFLGDADAPACSNRSVPNNSGLPGLPLNSPTPPQTAG
jgi:nitrogen-specific signal transduction histidine kinase